MVRYIIAWLLSLVTLVGLILGFYWFIVLQPQQAFADSREVRKAEQAESSAMSAYQQAFAAEVHKFALKTRIDQGMLNRDKHADCYIRVVMNAVISEGGRLERVSVEKSSGVPIVDKYFTYVIQQAAPYQPLSSQFSGGRQQVLISQEFMLDARLYNDKRRSKSPCDEL